MNWTVIIIVGALALALVIFLIVRNQKDEKKFEKDMNRDTPNPGDEHERKKDKA